MATIKKWISDPSHSELLFRVRHLMITNVRGEFRKFNVNVSTRDDDFSKAEVTVDVVADSVFTNEEARDKHLKSPDFFEVDKFRELTFKGTSIKKVSDNNYLLKGLLTIKGISKEVSLDVEYGGIMKDPWGKEKAGFSISGRINRKDWGLNWNAVIESGGVFVADEVQISGEIQLVRQE